MFARKMGPRLFDAVLTACRESGFNMQIAHEVDNLYTACALVAAGLGVDQLAMHFHDTYGQALANTYAALQAGITTYDASAGGLGGCPYARSATGNLATEDLVWLLRGLGVETGVDLDALVATSTWMAEQLGRPSPSAARKGCAPCCDGAASSCATTQWDY